MGAAAKTMTERNPEGVATAIAVLRQRFGDRLQTGEEIRRQHANTITWIPNQPPDAVVWVENKEEVSEIKDLVRKQTEANAQLTTAIIEQLAAREADNVCRILRQQAKETDFEERRRYRNDADAAQERYKVYKHEYYPESRCQV